MSKFQPDYNKAKQKEVRIMVPEIDQQIRELETSKRGVTDPDLRKGIEARIQALKIKKQSYRKGDPVKEDAQGAVTTGSIGSSTISTNDGGTKTSPFNNSSIFAPKVGNIMSRKGDIKKNKKKKKTCKEFVEYYYEV